MPDMTEPNLYDDVRRFKQGDVGLDELDSRALDLVPLVDPDTRFGQLVMTITLIRAEVEDGVRTEESAREAILKFLEPAPVDKEFVVVVVSPSPPVPRQAVLPAALIRT